MPLHKRKPFLLLEQPQDLEPSEQVFQVRFTKEIFRDYKDYLHRIDLYRQRLWSCKVTGKSNLTYEEALVSEKRGTEKVQIFPQQLIKPMLHLIQYSMLSLKNLADAISEKLQESWLEGIETYARKENSVFPCRIERILDDEAESMRYEIAWLGKEKEVVGNAVVTKKDIISKKFPYSRNVLKSFIRESTWRYAPWVIHDKLAVKHGISRDLPEELKSRFVFYNGKLVRMKEKRNMCREESESRERGPDGSCKRMKVDGSQIEGQGGETRAQCFKYPIEDLLVQRGQDDPVFSDRPAPSMDFKVPTNCVADLLMMGIWFSWWSPIQLFFICLLGMVVNISQLCKGKNATSRSDYMTNRQDLSAHVTTIKKGHYGLLSVDAKLDIFHELVDYALQTDIVRDQLDEFIDQWHELGATRRGEALEDGRKRREGLGANSDRNGVINGQNIAVLDKDLDGAVDNNHSKMNGELALEKRSPFLKKSRNCNALGISKEKKKKQEGVDVNKYENAPGGTGKNVEIGKISKELRKHHYEREMEKRFIRTNPLGKDRDRNRYWWFRRDARIFVESSDSKSFGYYNTKKELDALMGSLNSKGERERALQKQLEKVYSRICLELQKRSKDMAEKVALEEAVLRRSTRVRAPPRESPATAYLRYVNRWKED